MKKLLMALAVAVTTVVTQTALAATVAITGYDPSTRQVSLAFSGLERDMSLVAVADRTDKGTDDLSQWATSVFVGAVHQGDEALIWNLPRTIDAFGGAVRFVLLDLGGAYPVSAIQNSGDAYVDTAATGCVPTYNDAVELKFARVSGGCWLYDARRDDLQKRFSSAADSQLRVDRGGGATYDNKSLVLSKKYQLDVDYKKRTVELDGVEWGGGILTSGLDYEEMEHSLLLFAARYQGNVSFGGGSAQIFRFRIVDTVQNSVKMELLPCVKEGVAGFVDCVSHRFLANSGNSGTELEATSSFDVSESSCAVVSSCLLNESFRKISAVDFDETTGSVTFAFTTTGESNLLYVARADYDCGTDPLLWENRGFLAEVPANTTTLTCQLPADVLQGQGCLRFFLSRWLDQKPGLPINVTEVESLYSDGNAWINTGIQPDATTAISVVSKQDSMDCCVFGIETCFYFFNVNWDNGAQSAPNYYFGYGDKAGNNSSLDRSFFPRNKRTMRLGPDGAFIDDTRVSSVGQFDGTAFPETHGIALFCRVNLAGTTPSKNGKCTIYSAEIEKGGKLVRDLVPCVKGGVAQMYDRVTGDFLTNSGGGAFTAGEVVVAPPPHIENVESSMKVSVGCPTISFSVGTDRVMHVKLGAAAGRGVLYAACDFEDRGEDLALWANQVRLGAVEASDEAQTIDYELPAEWRRNKAKQYRVFYVTHEEDITEYEVESLYSDGRAWINTGIQPDATTAISVVSKQDSMDCCVFGIETCFYFFNVEWNNGAQSTPNYYFGYGDKTGNNPSLDRSFFPGNKRTMRLGPGGAFIDDTRVSSEGQFDGTTFPETHGIALFCRVNLAGTTPSKSGKCTIYSAEIEKGGKVVRDLVPCVKDGVVQMYDRVTGEHLTNRGSGEFTAGPRKARPASELVIGCSPCKMVGAGLFIVVK